ncbi:Mbov_0399 family ICE element protein [Spiroplasma eriocheiris]|uniref:Adhesin P123 n=1 Tax=Spiroplasma eriocheiris TaxID=315358 RepID=A0A0H3XM66_9MOLU|nr:hypothetical protein [Spiroplasma eriocheiris]AHF57510.1 putative transmembrane protein [Spiroplasma eriocheiris CCTCC M 207170]AKM53967.1 hypothetical protein SERIO_v1c03870 [Spiroplasma eriocheiris]
MKSKYFLSFLGFVVLTSAAPSFFPHPVLNNYQDKTSDNSLTTKVGASPNPFHLNIQSSINSPNISSHTNGLGAWGEHTNSSDEIKFLKWDAYEATWDKFVTYYPKITFSLYSSLGGGWLSPKVVQSYDVQTSDLSYQDSAFYIISYDDPSLHLAEVEGETKLTLIKDGSYLYLQLTAFTGAMWSGHDANAQIQVYNATINSTFSLDDFKNKIAKTLSAPITLDSDFSGSLEDANNIPNETNKLDAVLQNAMGYEYDNWKGFVQQYAFNDETKTATTTIKFIYPPTKEQQVWTFQTPISISLTPAYWEKQMADRLNFFPGKVVDPNDPTKLIDDTPKIIPATDKNPKTLIYHTTVSTEFDAKLDDNNKPVELMTVNGEQVPVLDNKFTMTLKDNRTVIPPSESKSKGSEPAMNVYNISLIRKSGPGAQYNVKVVIDNLIPTLQLKWYAWDPKNHPDQNTLITPTLPDGKPNPKYDPEINPKTGTKTQIIWVKRKSDYAFALDPLDNQGQFIKNKADFDEGFISEGSVSGKGVKENFDPTKVKTIEREGADKNNQLEPYANPNASQKKCQISNQDLYWSNSGLWHYIITTEDDQKYEKFVNIGPTFENKYPRFLDTLPDNIAVDFWTTIHGLHLKNYLMTYYNFDSKAIQNLSFEQTVAYWKEYVSNTATQRIPPDPHPHNFTDLSSIAELAGAVKMNATNIETAKATIVSEVEERLKKYKLVYNIDYAIYINGQILSECNEQLDPLFNYGSDGWAWLTIDVRALPTSTLAINHHLMKVGNNKKYDPTKATDLSKIKFADQTFDFTKQNPADLKKWILGYISNVLKEGKYQIVYQTDYVVKPLNDKSLAEFISNNHPDALGKTHLTIIIQAVDTSLIAVGSTSFDLINDPNATPPGPPPIPTPTPTPTPFPDNPGSWISKSSNLAWFLPLIIGTSTIVIVTIIYVKYKRKKGIGGKRVIKGTRK